MSFLRQPVRSARAVRHVEDFEDRQCEYSPSPGDHDPSSRSPGDVGDKVLAAGLTEEVRMDVVPVVFGADQCYFGSLPAQHLLEDPDVVIQEELFAAHFPCFT